MPELSTKRPTILNVNDTEGARHMTSLMLRSAGFDVIEAATGLQALALVAQHRPQLLVLDVQLPDIDGIEVCRRLRSQADTTAIKILHTSATYVTAEKKVESLDGGADGYLTQPFEPEELLATVRSLLRLSSAEAELRETAARLREEDQRKNEFLAMLAHELRNPLGAIVAALPALRAETQRDDRERAVRDVIERQAGQLRRLIDDLLDVARVTRGKIDLRVASVDLGCLVQEISENARRAKTGLRRQELFLNLPDQPIFVQGDAARLEQILENLIDNASKYTPEGGSISVALKLEQAEHQAWAKLTVSDTGIGMSRETLPNVFELFSQGEVSLARSRGGLGIGLTLVNSLVALHGGSISAQSAGVNCGSRFEISLPALARTNSPVEPRAPARRAGPRPEKRPVRVVLIEDNEDLQAMMAACLSTWGHEVSCASDGLSGLEKVFEVLPDVALVDIGLPGLDGYELAQRVRADARGRGISLFALTGYGAPEHHRRAIASGFQQVLVKPVSAERLRELLYTLPTLNPSG